MLSKNFKRLGSKFLAVTLAVATVMPSGFACNDSELGKKSWVQEHPVLTGAIAVGCTIGAGLIIAACKGAFSNKPEDSKTDSEQLLFVDKVLNGDIPINARLKDETALIIATKMGNDSKVKQLLEKGASVNVYNSIGLTPLIYAVACCKPDTVSALLHDGADVSMSNLARPSYLHVWESAVSRLDGDLPWGDQVTYGADYPLKKREEDTLKILNLLYWYGFRFGGIKGANTAAVRVRYGKYLCENLPSSAGNSFDAEYNKLLIKAGADLTQTDKNGRTPLVIAAEEGYDDVITELLARSYGQITEEDKENAKKAAEAKNHPEIVKLIK